MNDIQAEVCESANSSDINLVIASSHLMMSEILISILGSDQRCRFETAISLDELNIHLENRAFDLAIIDTNIFRVLTDDVVLKLIAEVAPGRACFLVDPASLKCSQVWLDFGIAGILHKSMKVRSIANAIVFMLSGETYVPYPMQEEKRSLLDLSTLNITDCEYEVLTYLGEGLPNREIARRTGKAEATIKMHIAVLFRKLKVRNRTSAVLAVKKIGLI